MFTGIITDKGEVTKIERNDKVVTYEIKTQTVIEGKKIGESISVNGACMTITEIDGNNFKFDAMTETLEKTNFSDLKKGSIVNLEPALTLNQGIDGHLVQGHIDTTGEIAELEDLQNGTTLRIKYPKIIGKYLALKGSITINGVSLTISLLKTDIFEVELIPHTLEKTNLSKLKKGDKVNLEVDLIARYIKRLLDGKEKETKYEFLQKRNLI